MSNFDFPVPSEVRGARDVTTVPTQALFLMNSPFVIQNAAAAGKRLIAGDLDDVQTATMAYRETLGRFPTESEIQRIVSFVADSERSQEVPKKKQDREPDLRQQRWASVYQALFACAEFRYCP